MYLFALSGEIGEVVVIELVDILGGIGVIMILAAYALLESDIFTSKSMRYFMLNGTGAALVLLSLIKDFNLAAFLLEVAWLGISILGMARALAKHRAG